jgi:hypothetical protein
VVRYDIQYGSISRLFEVKITMERDRKENRRHSFKHKNFKKGNKDFDLEIRDKNKIKNAFKHKKRHLQEEESWENWEDEIY